MQDDAYIDDLERFLLEAPVVAARDAGHLGGGGHANKHLLTLLGGVHVLAKEGANPQFESMAKREAATAVTARELGRPDLVPVTVFRRDIAAGTRVLSCASLQVMWPDPISPGPAVSDFRAEDAEMMALLDVMIMHTDRSQAANWLGFSSGPGLPPKPVGVDNGFSCDSQGLFPGRQFQSAFADVVIPQGTTLLLTGELMRAVERLSQPRQERHLRYLLGDADLEAMINRARQAAADGFIAHPAHP